MNNKYFYSNFYFEQYLETGSTYAFNEYVAYLCLENGWMEQFIEHLEYRPDACL